MKAPSWNGKVTVDGNEYEVSFWSALNVGRMEPPDEGEAHVVSKNGVELDEGDLPEDEEMKAIDAASTMYAADQNDAANAVYEAIKENELLAAEFQNERNWK